MVNSKRLLPASLPADSSCSMCVGLDPAANSPLQQLLPPGTSRLIAQTERFAALPTFGSFVPGYVLVVPHAHVLSFGQLSLAELDEAEDLVRELSDRIAAAYGEPVLGFEYGNNLPGGRRIGHAHWHLLPSPANLAGWLAEQLDGQAIETLAKLPPTTETSYISVRDQQGRTTVYPVPNQPSQRIRLRRAVAMLDPRVEADDWDFADRRFPENIRRTVDDLARTSAGGTS